MIFRSKCKIYYESFNFLLKDYGYKITSKNTKEGLWYSYFLLSKENFPDIKIEIEKGYLIVLVQISENNQWSLGELYKFLHHNKIVKCDFSNVKSIKNSFEKITRKYLDEVLENMNRIENNKIEQFYAEFPKYVFVWS